MNKKMNSKTQSRAKLGLAALVAALFGFCPTAGAQTYNASLYADVTPIEALNLAESDTYSTVFNASTTNTAKYLDIPVKNWGEFGLLIGLNGQTSSTNTITFVFKRSIDGTTFETEPTIPIQITIPGTKPVVFATNFSVGPFGFVRLAETRVTAGNNASNIVIHVSSKPWRYGIGNR